MFSWVTSWWKSKSTPIQGTILGPARNAPNDGINIKEFIEEQSKQVISSEIISTTSVITNDELKSVKKSLSQNAPVQLVIASASDVRSLRANLRKTPEKLPSNGSQDGDLLREMNNVCAKGHLQYFADRKRKREDAQKKQQEDSQGDLQKDAGVAHIDQVCSSNSSNRSNGQVIDLDFWLEASQAETSRDEAWFSKEDEIQLNCMLADISAIEAELIEEEKRLIAEEELIRVKEEERLLAEEMERLLAEEKEKVMAEDAVVKEARLLAVIDREMSPSDSDIDNFLFSLEEFIQHKYPEAYERAFDECVVDDRHEETCQLVKENKVSVINLEEQVSPVITYEEEEVTPALFNLDVSFAMAIHNGPRNKLKQD